jgi:DNA gyrase subunit A
LARKRSSNRNGRTNGDGTTATSGGPPADLVKYVPLAEETRRRYLNYALSVITSRALPDVRDGLKPVQRRILFVMFEKLRLLADGKTRKCAKICGDTTGSFHPHGDQAVYDALVRLGQNHTLREPLVIGQGNFGSIIGLPHAQARYTEAKLSNLAAELMSELRFDTVEMRDNYDATDREPVVLPARFPNLLVNGTQGIAVGMATNVPPHNLGEVIRSAIHLIKRPDATVAQLMQKGIKGPDFPLGGRIISDRRELRTCYEEGRGTIKVRGEWAFDRERGREIPHRLVITSMPYGVSTMTLATELGDIVEGRKLPQLLEANDESSEDNGLRIVLDLQKSADPETVMAYVYKHTSLEQNFSFNLTALVPNEQGTLVPARLSLVEMLRPFLDFRLEVVRRRFEFQLRQLERRIHVLEGFEIVFDGLDRALKIIRQSTGKADAAERLMQAFPLDAEQTNAILELQLYRISTLEIDAIRGELKQKRAEAERIRGLLGSERKLWGVVETELQEIADRYGDKRRTQLGSTDEVVEFDAAAYIVRENTNVVVTRDGWLKRVGRLSTVDKIRVREGDEVLTVQPASTLDTLVFLASDGVAYTLPVTEIPATTGHGDPLGKFCRLADGATIVNALTTDPRFTDEDHEVEGEPTYWPYVLVVTAHGQVLRISLSPYRPPSTKAGRRYARLRKGDRVVHADLVGEADETMFIATRNARVIHFAIEEVPILGSAGIGVRGIKLEKGDEVLGAKLLARPSDTLYVHNDNGTRLVFGQQKYEITGRGGKGVRTSQRHRFESIERDEIVLVDWAESNGE